MIRSAVLLAVVAALVVAASLVVGDATRQDAPVGPRSARVEVDPGRRGPAVGSHALGLSVEWDSVLPYTGDGAHRRATLGRLLDALRRAAGTGIALRVGGDSADQAWWDPEARPRPPTVLQDIGPATLDAVAWLARHLGGPVTLGLDLPLDDPANAAILAAEARRRLPPGRLAALEIGNEPDLYTRGHTFRVGGHLHRRLVKDPHYDLARYRTDVARYLRTLSRPAGPRLVVAGFAGPGWWPALPALLDGWDGRATALAAHLYALPQCAAPTPTRAWLMTPRASRGRVVTLAPLAALARRRGLPLRVAELNSAACGGRPGWSDTRAAALWLADALFATVHLGAEGADVHTWRGAWYAPFAIRGGRAVPRPPLRGMLAFARAAPAGSHLVAATVRGGGAVRAWATVDGRGVVRVLLVATRARHVVVAVRGHRPVSRRVRAGSLSVVTVA